MTVEFKDLTLDDVRQICEKHYDKDIRLCPDSCPMGCLCVENPLYWNKNPEVPWEGVIEI